MTPEENFSIIFKSEWYRDIALEVEMVEEKSFLYIMETLTRIGVLSKKENKLYQSCHIFTKKGKIYITHFKELYALDGKPVNLTKEDIGRRNTIACLLQEWGLLKIVDEEKTKVNRVPVSTIKIVKREDVDKYELVPKYRIGQE